MLASAEFSHLEALYQYYKPSSQHGGMEFYTAKGEGRGMLELHQNISAVQCGLHLILSALLYLYGTLYEIVRASF